jgi:hypothetical protein
MSLDTRENDAQNLTAEGIAERVQPFIIEAESQKNAGGRISEGLAVTLQEMQELLQEVELAEADGDMDAILESDKFGDVHARIAALFKKPKPATGRPFRKGNVGPMRYNENGGELGFRR